MSNHERNVRILWVVFFIPLFIGMHYFMNDLGMLDIEKYEDEFLGEIGYLSLHGILLMGSIACARVCAGLVFIIPLLIQLPFAYYYEKKMEKNNNEIS